MNNNNINSNIFVVKGKDLVAHGYTLENRPLIQLNPYDVPLSLRHLIPLAEYWGVNDDFIRLQIIKASAIDSLSQLINAVCQPDIDNELDDWLAGDEAEGDSFSAAYIAFSALRLAAEEAQSFVVMAIESPKPMMSLAL